MWFIDRRSRASVAAVLLTHLLWGKAVMVLITPGTLCGSSVSREGARKLFFCHCDEGTERKLAFFLSHLYLVPCFPLVDMQRLSPDGAVNGRICIILYTIASLQPECLMILSHRCPFHHSQGKKKYCYWLIKTRLAKWHHFVVVSWTNKPCVIRIFPNLISWIKYNINKNVFALYKRNRKWRGESICRGTPGSCRGHFLFWPGEGTLYSRLSEVALLPLSELSALVVAVSLKWCQSHSINSQMNSSPASRPSQQLNLLNNCWTELCWLTCTVCSLVWRVNDTRPPNSLLAFDVACKISIV